MINKDPADLQEARQERNAAKRKWRSANAEKCREWSRKGRLKARLKDPQGFTLKSLEASRRWKANNPEKLKEDRRQYRERRRPLLKKQIRAVNKVNNTIRRNKLQRQECSICQKPNAEAHHCDYDKPMEIFWLCKEHHWAWHRVFTPNF